MSGRMKLTWCALLTTVLAACAMLPLIGSGGWLFEAAVVATVVSAVGAACRRVPLPRLVTVLLQAVAVLLMLTVLFARDVAPLGLLPTPGVLTHFCDLLSAGGQDVSRYSIPAPATNGIRLMLVGGVAVVGLAVDAIAVTFRNAGPAGLPLLALYSVASGIAGSNGRSGSWLWFLVAAAGYLLLLLVEGGDRLSRWGRMFGGGPRTAVGVDAPSRRSPAVARTGRRIGVVALGLAVVVPLLLPSLGSGLLADVGDGSGIGGGGTISAVNPLVSLQNDLNQNDDREAVRYRTNAQNTSDMYLRIMALDRFDGTTWRFAQRGVRTVPDELPQPQGLDQDVPATKITTNFSVAPWYRQNYLPMPYPATRVDIRGTWRYEPEGRTLVGDRGQSTKNAKYTVDSLQVDPTAAQLAAAPPPPDDLLREYTEVPANLPPVVKRTARSITKDASDNYQKAVALQDHFALTGGFTYDTHVGSGTGSDAIARFLKEKRGFCIHFSFTMATMARTLGIPARVAIGFTPGTPQPDGTYAVSLRDAHAWPELYFQGVGWTRFEPTPSRGSLPDYSTPRTPSDAATGPTTGPESPRAAAPSARPSTSPTCAVRDQRLGDCDQAAAPGALPPSDPGSFTKVALGIGLAVVLLILLPAVPLLYRIGLRARRTGTGGHHRGVAGGSGRTLDAWHELVDTAWDHGIPPDRSETPRRAAERIVRLGRLDADAARSVRRLADAVEQAFFAPDPTPPVNPADDIRRARAGLRAAASTGGGLRALLFPRSSVRLIWAFSARWESLTARLRPGGWPVARPRRGR